MSSFFIWLILGKYFYCMSSTFWSDLTEAEQWGFSCHVVLTWHQAPGPGVVPMAPCSTFTATLIGRYCSLSPFYRWESGIEKWSNWVLNPGNSAPKSMFLTAILCSLSGGRLLWKLGKFRDRGNSQWVHSLQGGGRTTFWVRLRLAEQTGRRTRSRESSDGQCPALEAMLIVHLHEASASFLSPSANRRGGSLPEFSFLSHSSFPQNCWSSRASCHFHLDGLFPFKLLFWKTFLKSTSEKGASFVWRRGGERGWYVVVDSIGNEPLKYREPFGQVQQLG